MTILIFFTALLIIGYLAAKTHNMLDQLKKIILIIIIFLLVISIIIFPNHVFKAAQSGVNTWFNIVFPALLPFFIGAELLIQLGVIRFLGILLEPIIRPIFNIPGEGSFVFAMSVTSGYPMGAKLTSELRKQGVFTKGEAQRLLAFCSTSGPLFMIGAVAVGMFNNIQLGIIIAVSHYIGAIITGLCFRFYKPDHDKLKISEKKNYFKKALKELWFLSQKKQDPFGMILGSAVKKGVESLLIVGGFIILFSVIIRLLDVLGIIKILSSIFISLGVSSNSTNIVEAVISGIFEMTIGCKMLSEVTQISFVQQAILSSFLIAWSGFSIHAQSASFISGTDLSVSIYVFSKLLHSIFSAIVVVLILPIAQIIWEEFYTPAFMNTVPQPYFLSWQGKMLFSFEMFGAILIIIFLFAIVINIIYSISKRNEML